MALQKSQAQFKAKSHIATTVLNKVGLYTDQQSLSNTAVDIWKNKMSNFLLNNAIMSSFT